MNQKVKISVAADLDASSVEQSVNTMGQKIAQANRLKYQPVSIQAIEDVKKLDAALNEVLKTQSGLRKRVKDTNQESKPFTDWDWSRMYPHAASRGVAMQNVFERVVGGVGNGPLFTAPHQSPTPPKPGSPPEPSPKPHEPGPVARMAAGAAQAGLSATGSAGGVAAGAIGTGMSAGFGAGLMGLAGGLVALGAGKAVGAVIERMEQAERNSVEYDKLKRILGDVGVSFGALKGVVHASADNLKITYEEAGKLSTQFAKLANLSGEEFKTLPEEMDTGVGLSRSMGLDPSVGVGTLGQMRGLGITTNSQESRRMALLIGETIGKSNAFAKAEEVFEAIGGYASSQTRNSMGAANVAGYAGTYSAMVGSGIPGLDPTGAAGLLSRINATLAAGGAKGEASQFFSGIVGHRMGLDPFQTQVLREGGAFATNDEAFGADSAYAKFMGKEGPKGSTTFLQGTLNELRGQYEKSGTEEQKKYLAWSAANHLGVNSRQAMALLTIEPNKIGEMQDYAGDLKKISGSGITNLSKALYGNAQERRSLADNYLSRRGADAISAEDRKKLEAASGSDDELKKALASMAAKYDQERTTGSDIRDSKNALDNIKTNLADKLIPITLEMRHGIMHLAGNGNKSPQEIMKEVLELESKDRTTNIKGNFGAKADPLVERLDYLRNKERSLDPAALAHTYRDKPEVLEKKLKERADVQSEIIAIEEKLKTLSEEKAKALKEETDNLNERLRAVKLGRTYDDLASKADAATPPTTGDFARMDRRHGDAPAAGGGRGRGSGYDPLRTDGGGRASGPSEPLPGDLSEKLAEAERRTGLPAGVLASIVQQETGGKKAYLDDPGKHHYPMGPDGKRRTKDGTISSAFGPFGILEDSTAKNPGFGVAPLRDKSIDEQIRFASEYLAARSKKAGSIEAGLEGYGEGEKYSRAVMSRLARKDAAQQPPTKEGTPATASSKGDAPPVVGAVAPRDVPRRPAIAAEAPPRPKEGTPAASMGMQTESSYKPGAVTNAPLPPLTGEAAVTLDLSPDAKRLLSTPAAPMSMRVGPATPLGLKVPASMRQ